MTHYSSFQQNSPSLAISSTSPHESPIIIGNLGLLESRRDYIGHYFIHNYGCNANVYDGNKMEGLLSRMGYRKCSSEMEADIVLLNTCNIREKAAEKLHSRLGRLKGNIKKGCIVTVAGCVAQAEGEEIFRRSKIVGVIVGPQSIHKLPELIFQAKATGERQIDLSFPKESKFDYLPEESCVAPSVSAFVSIQEGCNWLCHFCTVPYSRGPEFSRPVLQIMKEISLLMRDGTKEIILVGQNVNGYHGIGEDGEICNLGRLIMMIEHRFSEVLRIRYTSSHPMNMHEELYSAYANSNILSPFFHLPVQSGSNTILRSMNRKHSREHYLQIVDKLHQNNPNIHMSTDLIVGYPGETDEDFQQTMELVREVKFINVYSFKYSRRMGTPAAAREDQVDEDVKSARLSELQNLSNEIRLSFHSKHLNNLVNVLCEGPAEGQEGYVYAKTPYNSTVYFPHPDACSLIGKIVRVRIDQCYLNSLRGQIS